MKRYCIVIADRGDGIQEPSGYEVPNGQFFSHDDISAHMLKLREVVEGMEHERTCKVITREHPHSCYPPPICDCRRCQALRLIGEACGNE